MLAAAVLAAVFVAFGFLASRLDFCCPFAMVRSLVCEKGGCAKMKVCEHRFGLGAEESKRVKTTANLVRGGA